MIKEHNFKFHELTIDRLQIEKVLGYPDGDLPEPFVTYLNMAYELATNLDEISAVVKTVEDVVFLQGNEKIAIAGLEFQIGKQVRHELKNSTQAALFICTAGATISNRSKELMLGEDPVLGFVYDTMGSFLAEAAGDKMQELLKADMAKKGFNTTNRYSPGYCNWPITDQHKLFSQFDGKTIDVELTATALMHPVKSISGIIGIGSNVRYRDYQCELCNSKTCIYRQIR